MEHFPGPVAFWVTRADPGTGPGPVSAWRSYPPHSHAHTNLKAECPRLGSSLTEEQLGAAFPGFPPRAWPSEEVLTEGQ